MELHDKVAVLTGGAGGIAKETARLFVEAGAKVVLVDLQQQALDKAQKELGFNDDQCLLVAADVSKEDDVAEYVRQTRDKFGKIDIFFNNAGIEGQVLPLVEQTEENISSVLDVNIKGVMYGLKHVMPPMIEQKSGSIINTASVAGWVGSPGLGAYVASKHAVVGLTKTAAIEAGDSGVRVNAICPAPVHTRMMRAIEQGAAPDDPQQVQTTFEQAIPMGRYGEPIEIAQLVLFLASDRSEFITGAPLLIDGGFVAQ